MAIPRCGRCGSCYVADAANHEFHFLSAALRGIYSYGAEDKSSEEEDFKTHPSICSLKVPTEKMKRKLGKIANHQINNVNMEIREPSKFNKMIK